MEVINLNFIPSGANPVAHASQFDEGRTTRFNLFDGSAVYTLDGTEIITVSVRKPDGHIVTESVTNTSSNYVEVVTTEQMTACAGDNLAQIKVEKGGDTIGFLNYILSVQKDPEDGGDPSASFIHDLETQVADMVATEVANQYDSANVIFDNDPTTGHGVGYAVTSEGVKNAIDAVGNPAASAVSYDNTGSGMTATNVQDAIDELDTNVGDLSTLTTSVTSSLVGAVNELAPTAYTQATRSSALSSGALGYVKIGKVVIANLNYTTNTSNVATHDTVLYSDLPPAISNVYLNFVDEAGNVTRVRMGTDGKMHLHYSTITANKEINGSFVYLSA